MERFGEEKSRCKETNTLIFNDIRISAISSRIIRVEKKLNAEFIDNKTQSIYSRDYCNKDFSLVKENNHVIVKTDLVKAIINLETLKFKLFLEDKEVKINNRQNLKGTIRTLDGNIGICPLPNGLMSKSGLTILEDSKTGLINEDGSISSREKGYIDFYILAFGRNYQSGLNELYDLTGRTPIIPKYALGNWWSRYHQYSDKEYLALMDKFKEKDIPFTVATVDMDWHIVKNVPKDLPYDPRFGRGWTGYTFEKELFPDYKEFFKELKKRHLAISLNLHPKDGVRYFESQYEDMAKANNVDPKSKKTIEFDLTNKTFRDSYFDILHHPYEKDGVDLWWIDWQQGSSSNLEGVDPLWLLNHYHFKDINREHPGLILSRYSGIGSHRYPLGFSGDTIVCWKSLKLQPYFTLAAANVGYTWWSHDIGGHMLNRGNNELYLRWLQLGVFLPINRLHSTNNTLSKEPWLYPNVEKDAIKYLQLRHKLIPLIYSASIENNKYGVPICKPLYYIEDNNYVYKKKYRNEFIFASTLFVAPVTKPMGKNKDESIIKVYFPKGKWINIFNNKEYDGNKEYNIECSLSEYPVYIKQGSFLPLMDSKYNEIDYSNLIIKTYLGDSNEFILNDEKGALKLTMTKQEDGYIITSTIIKDMEVKNLHFVIENLKDGLIVKNGKEFNCKEIDIVPGEELKIKL